MVRTASRLAPAPQPASTANTDQPGTDPSTSATRWSDSTLPAVPGSGASWGAAPVPTGEPGMYLMASYSGLLTHIDLAGRKVTALLQISAAFSTSTAVLAGGDGADAVLVTVDHSGRVSGVVGLENVGT